MSLLVVSRGLLPVMSSNSMTPNENTSDFSVSLPLDAYSGAKYLLHNKMSFLIRYSSQQCSFYVMVFDKRLRYKEIYTFDTNKINVNCEVPKLLLLLTI